MTITLELAPASEALLLDLANRYKRDPEEYASFLVTAALKQYAAEPVSHEEAKQMPAAEAAG